MATERFLVACESFYSIQGEGKTAGIPAVFLRLSGCNLRCIGFSYVDPDSGEHLGCDSKQLWQQGKHFEFSEIIDYWQQQAWLEKLNRGAHLVITGGEPLLQQPALLAFLKALDVVCPSVFIEVESNATLQPLTELSQRIHQFNLSPKLSHSGEPREKAYQHAVLQQFAHMGKANFKFVVAKPSDVEEILENYVKPFSLCPSRVWLMPEGGTPASINEKKSWLVELCKQHLFHFTTRLQVDIWNEVVGV